MRRASSASTPRGREVLTYLAGSSGPEGWSAVVADSGLRAMARLLREYHSAVRDFRPPLV